MASTYLTRTESSGNRKTGTLSFWVKRSGLGNGSLNQYVYSNWNTSVGGYLSGLVQFSSSDNFEFSNYQESGTGTHTNLLTNRVFRDTSAWYHIVVNWDTTQATSSDRYKMYINGVQETSFQQANYPSLNEDLYFNIGGASNPVVIGSGYGTSNYFDGSMSHYHFVDGTAYDATAFGEYDTNGVWKIKTDVSVTYGTNGFFILKDGNSVTDQSGNSNNFTVGGGTLTNTEDNPSNVFATANPLQQNSTMLTFTNGNNTVAEPSGNSVNWATRWGMSTLAFSSGKFYAEAKISDYGSGQLYPIGIVRDENIPNINSSVGSNGWGYYLLGGGAIIGNEDGTNLQTNVGTSTTGDIIGLAVDADNNTLQFYKNGSALGSQVTGITAGTYFFTSSAYANHGVQFNFGNGYFGTTAVASAGTNASGIGIFEHDVPNGYTALSTKGLNL